MNNITVIGSGTMGNGIAHVFALHGYQVQLIDLNAEALKKGIATIEKNLGRQAEKNLITQEEASAALRRIQIQTEISQPPFSDTDLVVEAVSENTEIKLSLFRQLDQICPPKTILASNTSSLSITKLGGVTGRPGKVIGMHFMNPVPVMKLIEVIRGYATSEETCHQIMRCAQSLQKIPVAVSDYPGFVANRILMPMINEAVRALHEGVAGVAEIDEVMKLGMSHPMGPLQLADFIGLDVCHAILKVMQDGLGDQRYAPCPLLVNMVLAGKLGVKTGEGFYLHKSGSKELIPSPAFKKHQN